MSSSAPGPVVAAIEAGGTKIVCGVGAGPDAIDALAEIPTRAPDTTLAAIIDFFRDALAGAPAVRHLGIGTFGPVELDTEAAGYGHFKRTPKAGWSGVDLVGPLEDALGLAVSLDTDVNAAALAEHRFGAARGLGNVVYITVGTGVGVGVLVDGESRRRPAHPEAGHMLIPRAADEPDDFPGHCPFHGDCVEGLASGAALVERFGARLGDLPAEHEAWRLEADYLASLCQNLTLALQPDRIVIGGGVSRPALLDRIRERLHERLAGYESRLAGAAEVANYLVTPALGAQAGLLGAIALAQDAALAALRRVSPRG
ncbi:MAG: ROK family protein, partial [Pseudomonadota bacterium]